MDTVRTKNGTVLPLVNLKGKNYLQVAHRIVWFNEEVASFTVDTELPIVTDEQTLAKVSIATYDQNGKMIRKATDFKRETKKDFADHTEKAVTGALGRALAQLGYGTAYALADLDEGERLADAPVVNAAPKAAAPVAATPATQPAAASNVTTFRKTNAPKAAETKAAPVANDLTEEWGD